MAFSVLVILRDEFWKSLGGDKNVNFSQRHLRQLIDHLQQMLKTDGGKTELIPHTHEEKTHTCEHIKGGGWGGKSVSAYGKHQVNIVVLYISMNVVG